MKPWNWIKSLFEPPPLTLYQRSIDHPRLNQQTLEVRDYYDDTILRDVSFQFKDRNTTIIHVPAGRYNVKIIGLGVETGTFQAYNTEIEEY